MKKNFSTIFRGGLCLFFFLISSSIIEGNIFEGDTFPPKVENFSKSAKFKSVSGTLCTIYFISKIANLVLKSTQISSNNAENDEKKEENEIFLSKLVVFLKGLREFANSDDIIESVIDDAFEDDSVMQKISSLMEKVNEVQTGEPWHDAAEKILESTDDIVHFFQNFFSEINVCLCNTCADFTFSE